MSLAKKIKTREVILDRLGITGERRSNITLQFCDHHDYVDEFIMVDYIDEGGKQRNVRCKLRVLEQYDKNEHPDYTINNNNNNNHYNLRDDKSFNGIIFINEGEVVEVFDRNNPSNCYNDYATVSDNYYKEDRKKRKRIDVDLQSEPDNDSSSSESSNDSLYDSDNDVEMVDDHILLYNSNSNNIVDNNNDNNITENDNRLDDDIFFEQEMVEYIPKNNDIYKCNYRDCKSKSNDNNIIMKRFPFIPKVTKTSCNVNRGIRGYAIRVAYRDKCMNRIGVDDDDFDHEQTIRICNKHEVNEEEMDVEWINKKGNKVKEKILANLPIQYVPSSLLTNKRPNKGCGHHRWLLNQIKGANENKENSQDIVNRNEMISLQRVHGLENNISDNKHISSLVSGAIGLYDSSKRNNLPLVIIDDKIEQVDDNEKYDYFKMKTKMRILDLLKGNNKTMVMDLVKTRTGFNSALDLISFIIIVCNGDINVMKQRKTLLSWFEEWCLFCGVAMGKNISRWRDAKEKYHVSVPTCERAFNNKLPMVLATRLFWPMYATFEEDHLFRVREKKDEEADNEDNEYDEHDERDEYDNLRIVMWDNTNVDLCHPSAAEAQRLTYSAYYGGNVAKGGIFLQMCNWTGTHPLWTGAVDDTKYLIESGILQQQEEYIQQYDNVTSDIAWTNLLDRGYKVTQEAWSNGNQLVLQPVNAPTGRHFNTSETLLAAGVAAVRAGNERAVKRVKTSAYLKNGQRTHESVERLNDMWLAYGFMLNFMCGTE